MISTRSLQNFIVYNSLIAGTGVLHYYVLLDKQIWMLFVFAFLRNLIASFVIEWASQRSRILNENYRYPGDVPYLHYMAQAAALESVTLPMITTGPTNILWTTVSFVPVSFLFEAVFDFFHYWTHRLLHNVSWSWHTGHHRHLHLRPQLTFHHHITDLILSNMLPFMITVWLTARAGYVFSDLEIGLLMAYKVFVEIGGHTGRSSHRSAAFPQCIWLPRFLGIELRAEDHNLHHVRPTVNFAKRFTLWDRAFGTYSA